jgi:hypothetical protein
MLESLLKRRSRPAPFGDAIPYTFRVHFDTGVFLEAAPFAAAMEELVQPSGIDAALRSTLQAVCFRFPVSRQ